MNLECEGIESSRRPAVDNRMQQGIRQAVLLLVLVLVAACSRAPEYESVAVDESAAPLVNEEGEQEGEEPVPSPKVESYAGHRADQRYRWKRR